MKKILISQNADGTTTTALIEGLKLIELIKDTTQGSSAGNIYLGIIKKITGSFIFLDIGEERQAFLDTKDAREKHNFIIPKHPGETMTVQVLKDAIADKGPSASSCISLIGRYIILYESKYTKINCSKKIINPAESKRLKTLTRGLLPKNFSAILRSAAENISPETIKTEIETLLKRHVQIKTTETQKKPTTLWAEPAIIKTLQEITRDDISEIITDSQNLYDTIKAEFLPLYPDFKNKLTLYDKDNKKQEPLFDAFFIKTQIDKLKDKHIWLKSGGFVVIEQTEVCVAIDVNTGKSKGKGTEAAKLALNLEAAKEIAYQLRLRNLSGIIIIDFLRQKSEQSNQKLLAFMEAELKKDRIPALLVGKTNLGLVEITRKRVRNPI
jgi:ribonuclease G